jgi:hypothetical protein
MAVLKHYNNFSGETAFMNKASYTLAFAILASVVRKLKDVIRMYKKVLISIMEKRMPIQDCHGVTPEVDRGR